MTVELTGMSGIQARVSAIQSQLDSMSGAASTASSTAFSAALTSASADATTSSTGTSSSTVTTGSTSALDADLLATGTSTASSAEKLISAAREYLGVKYKWGGTNPATGLDCSGFVQRAFKDIGITLPRVSADQARCGTKVASLADAKPGDLVAFDSPVDHIGIYLGNNKMIVAPKTGDVVKVQTIYKTPSAIRRVLPQQASGTAALTASLTSISGGASGIPSGSALAAAPAAYRSLFLAAQSKYGVPATLLASVAKAESGFNANAVSSAGARGLMQIMPSTARSLGVNPNDPSQAVDGAARLLRDNLKTFGSTELAVAAYNAGAGAVKRYGGIPPYAETRTYVRRVLSDSGVRAA